MECNLYSGGCPTEADWHLSVLPQVSELAEVV